MPTYPSATRPLLASTTSLVPPSAMPDGPASTRRGSWSADVLAGDHQRTEDDHPGVGCACEPSSAETLC